MVWTRYIWRLKRATRIWWRNCWREERLLTLPQRCTRIWAFHFHSFLNYTQIRHLHFPVETFSLCRASVATQICPNVPVTPSQLCSLAVVEWAIRDKVREGGEDCKQGNIERQKWLGGGWVGDLVVSGLYQRVNHYAESHIPVWNLIREGGDSCRWKPVKTESDRAPKQQCR